MSNIISRSGTTVANRRLDHYLFIGMDIHKDSHTASFTNCFGHEQLVMEIENQKDDFGKLLQEVKQISRKKNLTPLFGLEDSFGNGLRIANFLKQNGYEVKMVSPVEVDRKRKYKTHPEKSDSLDALGIAKVLIEKIDSLPNYSIAKEDKLGKQLRELANDRDYLVKEQTRIKNQAHVLLHRSYGSEYKKMSGFRNIFCVKAMRYWLKHPTPAKKQADNLVDINPILKNQIKRKINRLLIIHAELLELAKELEILIKQSDQKLKTISGCGVASAAGIMAEVRNISRFSSASKLAKYAGLAPRKKSSGKKDRHIKDFSGNRRLNAAIHRVAISQIGRTGNQAAKNYFAKKLKEGKSKVQALCCLKRRLVNIIYAMLKNKTEYVCHAAN